MGAVTSLSSLINLLTQGGAVSPENYWFYKDARTGLAGAAVATIVGRWTSLWTYAGNPAAGTAPSTATAPGRSTTGAMLQVDPTGGRQKWLVGAGATGLNGGMLVIYDRLAHSGGLSGTTTGAQTTNLPTSTLGRYTGAASAGNQIWLEVSTQIGATLTNVTASYTDQAGNTGHTTSAVPIGGTGLREAQRMIQLPLQGGDTGVRAVASITLAATTGTAGDIAVVIMRPLAFLQLNDAGVGGLRDFVSEVPGIVEVVSDAALSLMWLPQATTAPVINGFMQYVEV